MNRPSIIYLLQLACVSAATLLSTPAPAQAADCPPPLTGMRQRLLAQWEEGPDALRRFIYIRRTMLQLDINETAAWAEAWRAAKATCQQPVVVDVPAAAIATQR